MRAFRVSVFLTRRGLGPAVRTAFTEDRAGDRSRRTVRALEREQHGPARVASELPRGEPEIKRQTRTQEFLRLEASYDQEPETK